MNLEVIQNGRVLRTYNHNGQIFAEAPESGEYELRLTNTSPNRRMAVISVDGINVIDGKDAGVEGSGYVLNGWQTTSIKGFLRGSSECARFTFSASQGSYAAQTGRGTKNTGVIGVAVFDEKVKPVVFQPPIIIKEVHHHHSGYRLDRGYSQTTTTTTLGMNGGLEAFGAALNGDDDSFSLSETMCSAAPCAAEGDGGATKGLGGPTRSRSGQFAKKSAQSMPVAAAAAAPDLGTEYGRAESFFTTTTSFERATTAPVLVLSVRYGVRAKLAEWGVPVDAVQATPPAPNAFPASYGYAQPPAGWRG